MEYDALWQFYKMNHPDWENYNHRWFNINNIEDANKYGFEKLEIEIELPLGHFILFRKLKTLEMYAELNK